MPRATVAKSARKPKKPLSEADFLSLPDDGRKYELVDGEAKEVQVVIYHTPFDTVRLHAEDELTGGDLLPDFRVKVKELFEAG
ncbi:MAG: hypothetical protein ABDI19_05560 [Armatimonadota bacterium]